MNLENSAAFRIFIGCLFGAACTAPLPVMAQSMGYLAAKPLGAPAVQPAPMPPTTSPVFVVPPAPIMEKAAPEPVAPTAAAIEPTQQPRFFGPLRSRTQTAQTQNIIEAQPRGPLKAIYQDSKTALFHGLPTSLASQLPWVNYGNRNEPFESVLARVSLDLQSANASDPEWALPAQNEIRRLALRLDRLPAPPNYVTGAQSAAVEPPLANANRPFRPRPIWPGASANIETQVRPTSLTTTGVDEIGGATAGENIIWQNLEPAESTPPSTPRPSRRARR